MKKRDLFRHEHFSLISRIMGSFVSRLECDLNSIFRAFVDVTTVSLAQGVSRDEIGRSIRFPCLMISFSMKGLPGEGVFFLEQGILQALLAKRGHDEKLGSLPGRGESFSEEQETFLREFGSRISERFREAWIGIHDTYPEVKKIAIVSDSSQILPMDETLLVFQNRIFVEGSTGDSWLVIPGGSFGEFSHALDTKGVDGVSKPPRFLAAKQFSTIRNIHESFSRGIAGFLSDETGVQVKTARIEVQLSRFGHFRSSLARPSIITVLEFGNLDGNWVLGIDPTVVSRVLGEESGNPALLFQNGVLTEAAVQGSGNLMEKFLEFLRKSWLEIIDLSPRVSRIESNPIFASFVPALDSTITVTIEIVIGEVSGNLSLAIPMETLLPIAERIPGSDRNP